MQVYIKKISLYTAVINSHNLNAWSGFENNNFFTACFQLSDFEIDIDRGREKYTTVNLLTSDKTNSVTGTLTI